MSQHKRTRELVASVPDELWAELATLQKDVSKNRGYIPLDCRPDVDRYFDLIKHVHETYSISLWSMSTNLGLNGRTLLRWMGSRGYGNLPPSMSRYKGTVTQPRGIPVRLVVGALCNNGHVLTAETLAEYRQKNGRIQRMCRTCRAEQARTRKASL